MNIILRLLNNLLTPFYSPDDALGPIGDIARNPVNAILDEGEKETKDLIDKDKEDDENKEDTDDTDEDGDKEDGDENEDSEKADEEVEEDKDKVEETEEEKEISARITQYTDIKKAYPEFFTKFPDIRAALFRDQRYGEIFGTVDDAENAFKKANALDELESDIVENGDPSKLLEALNKNSPESLEKFSFNLLSDLQKANKDLYLEVAAIPIKQLLRSAWKQGKGKETDLGKAAAHIHQFFFDNLDFDSKVKGEGAVVKSSEKSKSELEFERRLKEMDDREYGSFKSSVDNSYLSQMTKEVSSGLDNDERITPYMKSKMVDDILTDIKNSLVSDSRYMSQMQSLWKQAKTAKFSNDFKSRLVSTALARAKSLIPAARQKIVAAALKVEKKKSDDSDKKEDKNSNRRNFTPRDKSSKDKSNRREEPLTDRDILRSA